MNPKTKKGGEDMFLPKTKTKRALTSSMLAIALLAASVGVAGAAGQDPGQVEADNQAFLQDNPLLPWEHTIIVVHVGGDASELVDINSVVGDFETYINGDIPYVVDAIIESDEDCYGIYDNPLVSQVGGAGSCPALDWDEPFDYTLMDLYWASTRCNPGTQCHIIVVNYEVPDATAQLEAVTLAWELSLAGHIVHTIGVDDGSCTELSENCQDWIRFNYSLATAGFAEFSYVFDFSEKFSNVMAQIAAKHAWESQNDEPYDTSSWYLDEDIVTEAWDYPELDDSEAEYYFDDDSDVPVTGDEGDLPAGTGIWDFPLFHFFYGENFGLGICDYPELDEIDVGNTKFFRWVYRQVLEYLSEEDYQEIIESILVEYPEVDPEDVDLDYVVNYLTEFHMTLVEFCDYVESVDEESGDPALFGAQPSTFFSVGLSDFPQLRDIFLQDFGLEACNYPNLDEIDVGNTKFFRWLVRQVLEYLLEEDYQEIIESILVEYPEVDPEDVDLDYVINDVVETDVLTLVGFCNLIDSVNSDTDTGKDSSPLVTSAS